MSTSTLVHMFGGSLQPPSSQPFPQGVYNPKWRNRKASVFELMSLKKCLKLKNCFNMQKMAKQQKTKRERKKERRNNALAHIERTTSDRQNDER